MKVIVAIGIILLFTGAGVVYFYNQSLTRPQTEIQSTNSPQDKMEVKDNLVIDSDVTIGSDSSKPQAGSYEEYSQDGFGYSADKKRVFFFYASWCPTCRPVDTEIKANINKIPGDLVIFRVNYNDPETDEEEKALAEKYNITYQHTFVQVDENGNEITKWNGGGLDNLLSKVK